MTVYIGSRPDLDTHALTDNVGDEISLQPTFERVTMRKAKNPPRASNPKRAAINTEKGIALDTIGGCMTQRSQVTAGRCSVSAFSESAGPKSANSNPLA